MKDNQYDQGNEYSQHNEYYQGNEVSLKDNEYYKGAAEWYTEKDETATLLEETVWVPTLKEDKSDTKKARKKKSELLNKTAGITASAVAVVLVASTLNITGSSHSTGICPYCYYSDCAYWDYSHDCETIRVELDGTIYTTATNDKYQMGMLQSVLDSLNGMQTRTIWMEDGRRAYMQASPGHDNIAYDYSWGTRWDMNTSIAPQTEESIQTIVFTGEKRTGWIHEATGVYTVAQLVYMPDGSRPSEEVYHNEVELPYVEMEKISGEDYLWFRVASNEVITNLSGILENCEVYIVDEGVETYDLGDTMVFTETEAVKRVWGDDNNTRVTYLHGNKEMTVQEYFRNIEYSIDGDRTVSFEFSTSTYEEIFEKWDLLNTQAPRRGHKVVVPVYQLDDYEYGGITYQVFVRDEESVLESGYDMYLSPKQEKNFAIQTYLHLDDVTELYNGNSLEALIGETELASLEQILGCITLR